MSNVPDAAAWHRITVATTRTGLAEAVFEHCGAIAISIVDAGATPTVEQAPAAHPDFTAAQVVGLFAQAAPLAAITQALRQALGADVVIEVGHLSEQNWADAWRAHHPPTHFGGRLWVAPHGASVEAAADAIIIRLDPGLAFGTGTHPTTALCLHWLAQADVRDCTVLDYGCGSGILAIAAARLGAAQVVAVDIDPQALSATRANAAQNNVAERIRTASPDALEAAEYDLVLANILARPLIELATLLARHTRSGGRLLLSGLLARQIASVEAAYAAQFCFAPPAQQDGWVRLDATRRPCTDSDNGTTF
ncbi:MAG TPA: 50S ribosomal protein L11 methyltransferase [Salinisphaeraceae bacterium]|nr:50S ribosomal protein L11 methyltransferase [Salinisphaeraceae bacterium]